MMNNSPGVIILDIDTKGNHKGAKLLAGDRNSNVDNSHSLGTLRTILETICFAFGLEDSPHNMLLLVCSYAKETFLSALPVNGGNSGTG